MWSTFLQPQMHYKVLLIEILRTYEGLRIMVFSEDATTHNQFPKFGAESWWTFRQKRRRWAGWTDLRSSTEWNRQLACPHDP